MLWYPVLPHVPQELLLHALGQKQALHWHWGSSQIKVVFGSQYDSAYLWNEHIEMLVSAQLR